MENFWDYSVWGTLSIFALLFCSLLAGSILRKIVPFLKNSLIPTSVIGGIILILISAVYKSFSGTALFDAPFFGGSGVDRLEVITYHALALGFISSTLKQTGSRLTKKRTSEIFNTGVTTVSTYLLQGFVGLTVTLIAARVIAGFFPAAGVLLPFGYGQGTGQALNYGNIFQADYGFDGGRSFGLTIAALGFLSASIGGVLHLNILKHMGRLRPADPSTYMPLPADPGDRQLTESMDKMTVQISLIALVYFATYWIMRLLGVLLPGMRSVIYGFNFLIGVLMAILAKTVLRGLHGKGVLKKKYTDNFLLTRISNLCFDVMIVSGIAAIRLDMLEKYWGIIIILGLCGAVFTYVYLRFVCKKLFPTYAEEQFLMLYGMLTGTASTGTILLRELDGEFRTPASDNMIYQNLPAILLGFPMMIIATIAPRMPIATLVILLLYFAALNLLLFRERTFSRKRKK